jgi:hypothetical protein
MSAVCRIIHLHGGPSDGLCLAWNERVGHACVTEATTTAVFPEYDYIYVPRTDGTVKIQHAQVVRHGSAKCRMWRQAWNSCRAWLLAPCSYPLDTRHLQIPVHSPESLKQNQ